MIDLLPNQTIFIQWLLFIAVFLILRSAVFGPVLRILETRRLRTEGEAEEAVRRNEETARMTTATEERLLKARLSGGERKEQILLDAFSRQSAIVGEVRAENQKILHEIQTRVEQEGHKAALQLRQYAQKLGKEIAEKILERTIVA